MRTFKITVSVICMLVGVFFLMASASDIQLGFGAVLLFLGALSIPAKHQSA